MRLLTALALFMGLGLMLGQATGAGDKKKEGPQGDDLDGTWLLVAMENAGKKEADNLIKGTKLVIKGKAFTLYEGKDVVKGTFKADAAKTPKEVDAEFDDGAGNKVQIKSIYEVKGDVMRVCGAYKKDRPKDFKSTVENGYELLTYKRAK